MGIVNLKDMQPCLKFRFPLPLLNSVSLYVLWRLIVPFCSSRCAKRQQQGYEITDDNFYDITGEWIEDPVSEYMTALTKDAVKYIQLLVNSLVTVIRSMSALPSQKQPSSFC